MSEWAAFAEANFVLLFAICLTWVVLVLIASAFYRASKGKSLLAKAPDQPVFLERWTSGRSMRSALTKLGGAKNCLLVGVTREALIIRPHFPFTLLFLPELYQLDWTIARRAIRRVERVAGRRLLVEFLSSDGSTGSVELMLRRSDQFREALAR